MDSRRSISSRALTRTETGSAVRLMKTMGLQHVDRMRRPEQVSLRVCVVGPDEITRRHLSAILCARGLLVWAETADPSGAGLGVDANERIDAVIVALDCLRGNRAASRPPCSLPQCRHRRRFTQTQPALCPSCGGRCGRPRARRARRGHAGAGCPRGLRWAAGAAAGVASANRETLARSGRSRCSRWSPLAYRTRRSRKSCS